MKDNCMSFVHLLYGSNLDVLDDSVNKKLEEFDGDITTIEKVCSSDGEKIRYSRPDLTKEFI